ncbi:hypothetical protein, partial [Nostoc sp.]|uniref:hypothetical protein n=1 Tax=Nostoc sp. TaxID=1180 RepID=UPI002FF9CBEC
INPAASLHPRSKAQNTELRSCSSGVFGIHLIIFLTWNTMRLLQGEPSSIQAHRLMCKQRFPTSSESGTSFKMQGSD